MVFVTGLTNGIGDEEYATIAYDSATGHKLWASLYNGSPCTDAAIAVAVSPDGSKVFATGSSGCLGLEDYATVAYDATTGQELWVSRYNGPTGDPDEAFALAVSLDGTKVFVTGRSFGVLGEGRDYATVAYDTSTGEELWVSRYDGPAHGEEKSNDEAYALVVSRDGTKVFVTGVSGGNGSASDYGTVAYNPATGQQLWLHRYNGPANVEDFAQAVAVSPDGSKVFVTGYSYGVGTFSDYATLAIDASTGQELWIHRYDDPTNGFDFAYALAVSPDGSRVFVTGSSDGVDFTISDYVTQAYDAADGGELWLRRYNGPGNSSDSASAVAASPDGTMVFVTGLSSGLGFEFPFDCATVAYDAATGQGLWHHRFNGPSNRSDIPYDMAVSPDGAKVFVTGTSDASVSGTNYLTLAYAAVAAGQ
jgi:outer membrane protein assembly factor BamB